MDRLCNWGLGLDQFGAVGQIVVDVLERYELIDRIERRIFTVKLIVFQIGTGFLLIFRHLLLAWVTTLVAEVIETNVGECVISCVELIVRRVMRLWIRLRMRGGYVWLLLLLWGVFFAGGCVH